MTVQNLVKSTSYFIQYFACQRRMYNTDVHTMAQTLQEKSAHKTEESRREVHALVNHLKPEILFLELDKKRGQEMQEFKLCDSEFYVAYMEGLRCGSRIIFGDWDEMYMWLRMEEQTRELYPSYKPQSPH